MSRKFISDVTISGDLTGRKLTLAATSAGMVPLTLKGFTGQTGNLLSFVNISDTDLGYVKIGGYTNIRQRSNITLSAFSYTADDGTENLYEIYDPTSGKYLFQIRPRRTDLLRIHLNGNGYTQILGDDTAGGGRIDFIAPLMFIGMNTGFTWFRGAFGLTRLGDAGSNTTSFASAAIVYEPSIWAGSLSAFVQVYNDVAPVSGSDSKGRWRLYLQQNATAYLGDIISAFIDNPRVTTTSPSVGLNTSATQTPVGHFHIFEDDPARIPTYTKLAAAQSADASRVDNSSGTQVYGLSSAGAVKAIAGIAVGGGANITKVISSTAVLDFGNVPAYGTLDLTMTVTGAVIGDTVILGIPNAAMNAKVHYQAWVSATNTVTIRAHDWEGTGTANPGSATFRATILQF